MSEPENGPVTDRGGQSPRAIRVLLVEDDEGDVVLTREAFDEYLHNRLDVVNDGNAALEYLRNQIKLASKVPARKAG